MAPVVLFILTSSIVIAHAFTDKIFIRQQCSFTVLHSQWMSWSELETAIGLPSNAHEFPVVIDSVLDPSMPNFSTDHPTLFRERHGWCPYSERVWLTMEMTQMKYDTVRIDNTGGPRPNYYKGGQTPQIQWPEGRTQGESMDLVHEIDRRYANGKFRTGAPEVQNVVSKFRSIFPRARPSSRAAFLFQMNGEPLWKKTFQDTLRNTDELLSSSPGPFFCGSEITAADIAWTPFLERYRYQLPCLHEGLDPADPAVYPHLARWYDAMDQIPEYACCVKGDASSWRKVLSMAGFGNAGLPPQIQSNMDNLLLKEDLAAKDCIDLDIWQAYAKSRPYVQSTPSKQAAAIIIRNRNAIVKDTAKQASKVAAWKREAFPSSEDEADFALRTMAQLLLDDSSRLESAIDMGSVQQLATFLDYRMCVPRDMGAMSAATIKNLAVRLRTATKA